MLAVDVTLFIQIANFLLLLFILNIILFRPIRGMLARRRQETESLRAMITDYESKLQATENDIRQGMAEARKEAYLEREGFKSQGLEEEKGILQNAGAQVEAKVGNARGEIEAKMEEVRRSLESEVTAFSGELAQKILGRPVG